MQAANRSGVVTPRLSSFQFVQREGTLKRLERMSDLLIMDILKFLHSYNKEKFIQNLDKYIKFGTDDQIQDQWVQCGSDGSGWATSDVSNKHKELFPENSRNTGAKIFNIIEKTKKNLLLQDSVTFAADSLFCEWAYVVDFDKNVFEIYEGFNNEFLDSNHRFSFLIKKDENEHILDTLIGDGKSEYFPVKIVKTFNLDSLPTEEEFLKEFKEDEE